jgi:putative hydrolase of the HAD superfamily
VLKSFAGAGIPIAIVSNTGWSINKGYVATGLDAFIHTFVLSCDLGIAKPDPSPSCSRASGLASRPVTRSWSATTGWPTPDPSASDATA